MKINASIIILLLAIFIVGGIASHYLFPNYVEKIKVVKEKEVSRIIDTVKEIVYRPKISIRDTGRIVYRVDTLIITKPFVAILDTIAKGDSISVAYYFPENQFYLSIGFKPDEKITIKEYITIEKTVEVNEAWWIKPCYVAGSLILGYGLGSIK